MKIVLGIPSAGEPAPPFLAALGNLRLPAGVTAFERSVYLGNYIPAQREMILDEALAMGAEYLWFVDDDVVVPPDALEALLAVMRDDPQTAVVGGLYYTRDGFRPLAVDVDWTSSNLQAGTIPAFTTTSTGEVGGVGFGCALLRLDVAANLPKPVFSPHIYIERTARRVRQADEDYRYCESVRALGRRIRLHGGVRCGHYERATQRVIPEVWEDDATTNQRRIPVLRDGRAQLIPDDPSIPMQRNEHRLATVEYVYKD